MSKYYLAYGSNLNLEQMKHRCPTAKPVGTAFIEDYRLMFKGSLTGSYLTIEKEPLSQVPVGVWLIEDSDEASLDIYEGYPTFYYKKHLALDFKTFKGKTKHIDEAIVYIMHEDRTLGTPSAHYMKTCLDGYKNFKFERKYLIEALVYSQEEKDNDN